VSGRTLVGKALRGVPKGRDLRGASRPPQATASRNATEGVPYRACALACALLALAAPPAAGQGDDAEAPGRAPLVGRPADVPFTEGSASFAGRAGEYRAPFEVVPSVDKPRVEVLEQLLYTVTIRAVGKLHHPPARFDLSLVPAFKHAFEIEDLTEKEQVGPAEWCWVFGLRPKGSHVREVPGLPFAYYNPDLQPPERGFQVLWTDPVALEVREPEPPPVPVRPHPDATVIAVGPAVRRAERPWPAPGGLMVALAWAVPAALSAAWYAAWRWLYPDAARAARRRRSRAARLALRALAGLDGVAGRLRGERVAAVVAEYLRERFELAAAEPTPEEGRALLLARRLPGELPLRAAELLAGCDAARFAPDVAPDGSDDLPAQARTFILAVEEQACTPPP
jgi:hypothetical protein